MSRREKYSFLEEFLRKNSPGLMGRKLEQTKTGLRNKPIMMVTEKKPRKTKAEIKSKARSNKKNAMNIKKFVCKRIITKPTNTNYSNYLRLYNLWKQYIDDLLSGYMTLKKGESELSLDIKNAQEVLLKADYHGARITVADSPCSSLRGQSGIVLQETKQLFIICSTENKMVKVPKHKTIFTVECLDGYRITLFGSQFCLKPPHRLTKKFSKNARLKELL